MDGNIIIVGKRQKKEQQKLAEEGYLLLDVTSTSEDATLQRFSPMYPHGKIPVPGMGDGVVSESVEGVWQGLKVFDNEGVDPKKFKINTMKGLKRPVNEKRGKVVGHSDGKGGMIKYMDARKSIYVPTYQYVLMHRLNNEMSWLMGLLAEGNKLAFLDYDTNENVDDPQKPLSHASLIKAALHMETSPI